MGIDIWGEFLTLMNQEVGTRVVETWFKAVTLIQWDVHQQVVYLEAPNAFVRDWIKNNYVELIQFHLGRLLQVKQLRVVLLDARRKQEEPVELNVSRGPEICSKPNKPHGGGIKESTEIIKVKPATALRQINKNYSFDTFIVGAHNSLAYAAAHAVSEKPGTMYNPLFISGCSGIGKTHLLHAIGNKIKSLNKGSVVVYQAADRFVREFIHAVRSDKVHYFHAKYQNIDVLLLDDVQFLANKEQTQDAFFHIFNTLYESHKQIVFSGDMVPRQIKGLAQRLQSRLSGGLVADIDLPDLESKIAIIKKKAELSEEIIDDNVAAFIASAVHGNIRELEGALVRVVAFATLTKQPVDLELAQKILGRVHVIDQKRPQVIDLDAVIKVICKHYPYNYNELISKNRSKDLAFVRHLTIYLMKKITDKSLRDIGRFLGGRDHATVVHAVQKIEKSLKDDPHLMEVVLSLKSELGLQEKVC